MSYPSTASSRRNNGGGKQRFRPSSKNRSGANTNTRKRRFSNKKSVQLVNPSDYIKEASPVSADDFQPAHLFTDFSISSQLSENIAAKGFIAPTPIQDQAIPAGLKGRDVIGIAGTGTGKTIAFAVSLVDKLLKDKNTSALIIAPTRELAQQIDKEMQSLIANTQVLSVLLVGGAPMNAQIKQIRRRPRILIGTPGRLKDHMERGTIKLRKTNLVVLDEVDRMLDMGFLPDVTKLLSELHPDRQSFFFSATMEPRIMQLIETFARDPITIKLQTNSPSGNIHQNVVRYSGKSEKLDKLHDVLLGDSVTKIIIFDETKHGVDKLHVELRTRGFSSDSIHGGKSLGQRRRALSRFKNSDVKILVATDVAARGIDVADVSHVINYSVPQQYDDYVHRIGRAGRAGQIGHAVTFIDDNLVRK